MPKKKPTPQPTKQQIPKPLLKNPTKKQVGIVDSSLNKQAFDSRTNFNNSFKKKFGAESEFLQELAQNVLFDKAIERISNGVAAIPWIIDPPEDLKDDKEAIAQARRLTRSLRKPSYDLRHNTYRKFIKSTIKDLLIFGSAAIERQPGYEDDEQAFWLWGKNPAFIKLNAAWDGEWDEPHYWYCPNKSQAKDWTPIFDENMFLVQSKVSSFEIICPSPIKLAYDDINTWMNLHGYQSRTVSNGVRDYMINIENAGEEEIEAFREYWRTNVVGLGEIPIIGGKVSVVKFGARNDEELFLKYTEFLTGLIALYFGLSHRDVGNQREDSYATAEVAQSHSFQDAILPIAQVIIDDFNNQVIDYYYPEYILQIADTEPRKEIEEAQRATTLFQACLITRNESRRMIGEPPLEGGDVFFDGSKPGDVPIQPGNEAINNGNKNILPFDTATTNGKKQILPENEASNNGNGKVKSESNGKVAVLESKN
jgi:hypothetical protein